MAAFTTGADWSFDNLPGSWQQQQEATSQATSASQTSADTQQQCKPEEPQDARPEPTSASKEERTHWPPRQCRICLEVVQPTTEIDDTTPLPASFRAKPKVSYVSEDGGRLLRPCKCKDPSKKRNYWECPTCRYRYRLQRLTWAAYISSTTSQIGLTLAILFLTTFMFGFVADPIINLYLDPLYTITTIGGPTGSLIYEDEPASWTEHFAKGLASIGFLGFAKFVLTMSPFNLLNIRTSGLGGGTRGHVGGNGRDRISTMGWLAILIGVVTFLVAVWKAVRAWSRRTLQAAGERVMDVPGTKDDDEDDNDMQQS